MKVKLNKRELFWSLINPQDFEDILVVLNESNPEANLEDSKLPEWAKDQIASSEKLGKINVESSVKVASTQAPAPAEKQKPSGKKKVSKKATAVAS